MDENSVGAAMSSIRAAVESLNSIALQSRLHADAMDDARDCWNGLQALESVWVRMVRDLEGRALPEGLSTKAFLRSAIRRTTAQAGSDVRAAKLQPPRTGEAFAAGQISRAHVDVIVRTIERIPADVCERQVQALPEFDIGPTTSIVDAVDAFFAQRAREYDSYQLQCLAKAVLAALLPDADDGFDPDAYDRRSETHARDENGMLHGNYNLDAATGADLAAAIDHFSKPIPRRTETADDGSTIEVSDSRTPAQRRADALGLIARLAMGAAEAGTKGGESPRIVLYTGIEDYHDAHCSDTTHRGPQSTAAATESADRLPYPQSPTPAQPKTAQAQTMQPETAQPGTAPPETAQPAAAQPETKSIDVNPTEPEPQEPEPPEPAPSRPEPVTSQMHSVGETLLANDGAEAADDVTAVAGSAGPWLFGRKHGATDTHLGAIGLELLARFACDAVLEVALMHPTGAVLNLGRDARTVTPAQRRALAARDRGCVIPGCTAPASWCHGHHVTWWEKGGLTDLDNLALVCGHHHTAVHLGLWELRMLNGLPWARPRKHIDPQRRWIRNSFHEDLDNARGLGVQLRLNLPTQDQSRAFAPAPEEPAREDTPESVSSAPQKIAPAVAPESVSSAPDESTAEDAPEPPPAVPQRGASNDSPEAPPAA